MILLLIVDADMSDLSARSVGAHHGLSIHDDSAAHAGSQSDHDQILLSFACAQPHLAQRSHIGIIAHRNLHLRQVFHLPADFLISPSKVCRILDDAFSIYRGRNANPDARHLLLSQFLFLHLLLQGIGYIRKDRLAFLLSPGLNLPLLQ